MAKRSLCNGVYGRQEIEEHCVAYVDVGELVGLDFVPAHADLDGVGFCRGCGWCLIVSWVERRMWKVMVDSLERCSSSLFHRHARLQVRRWTLMPDQPMLQTWRLLVYPRALDSELEDLMGF